jgi:hypothetical protein
MIYASPREAKLPGFDRWYWDILATLPKARRILLIAGAYDSDNTIKEFLEDAKRRAVPVSLHFVEAGPLSKAFDAGYTGLAARVPDLDAFEEENGVPLDDSGEISLDF